MYVLDFCLILLVIHFSNILLQCQSAIMGKINWLSWFEKYWDGGWVRWILCYASFKFQYFVYMNIPTGNDSSIILRYSPWHSNQVMKVLRIELERALYIFRFQNPRLCCSALHFSVFFFSFLCMCFVEPCSQSDPKSTTLKMAYQY